MVYAFNGISGHVVVMVAHFEKCSFFMNGTKRPEWESLHYVVYVRHGIKFGDGLSKSNDPKL